MEEEAVVAALATLWVVALWLRRGRADVRDRLRQGGGGIVPTTVARVRGARRSCRGPLTGEFPMSPARLFSFIVTAFAVVPVLAADRPNVVIVITDDQGYGDMSCHGNAQLRTPNIDALHAESVR